jgi:chromosome segregation ATPase
MAKQTTDKEVTNQEILTLLQEFMQMTSDNFERLENRMGSMEDRMGSMEDRMGSMENRMDGIEGQLQKLWLELNQIKSMLHQHGIQLNDIQERLERLEGEQKAQGNDIKDVWHRIAELEKKTDLNVAEQKELKQKLEMVIAWAKLVAEQVNIPLKLV